MIDGSAKGVVATDRLGSYNWLAPRRRQICWAHLRRDFQALVDRGGESSEVGRALLGQVKRLFTLWHEVRDGRLNRVEFQAQVRPVRRRVKELLVAGGRSTHRKTRRSCANILKVEPSLWSFVRAEGVEPTNNTAERGLRRAVLWRKNGYKIMLLECDLGFSPSCRSF